VSLTDGPTLRAAAGSVLYLALIALLSIGIATLVRDSAAAIGVILGLLYLVPILLGVITDPKLAPTHPTNRTQQRRPGHPKHHRTSQPPYQPLGRPRRPGRMGRRSADRRRPTAGAARRLTEPHPDPGITPTAAS